jgi:hypothetical protein
MLSASNYSEPFFSNLLLVWLCFVNLLPLQEITRQNAQLPIHALNDQTRLRVGTGALVNGERALTALRWRWHRPYLSVRYRVVHWTLVQ